MSKIKDIIENDEFKLLSQKHINQMIDYLYKMSIEFSIVANIESTTFEPNLPENLKKNLHKFSLFTLAGYTFSTVKIDDDFLYFEAGFGEENFGSLVKIPLYSIFQIVVDESILYINLTATVDKFHKDLKTNSFNVFKNNPKNKKFN